MSTSISSVSPYQADGAQAFQQRRQNFEALTKALQSNDLNAAKQAYNTLVQNAPNGTLPADSPLAKIGQALQANDLTSAQSAFSTLQAGRHKHHHHGNPPSDPSTTGSLQTGTTSNTGNTINVAA